MDDLGDRMKQYESHETDRKFMNGLTLYARIDGRGFSKFTKHMQRPFDTCMMHAMVDTTKHLVDKTHACVAYHQSDEISIVWRAQAREQPWFDGKITKMTSVLAGLATSAFVKALFDHWPQDQALELMCKLPHFDARVIALPNETEAANMLLWRNLDATKNAISMAAHHYYSHAQLQHKSGSEKQEMLFEKGINFNDYPSAFKRGTFVKKRLVEKAFDPQTWAAIPLAHRPPLDQVLMRSECHAYDLPPLSKVTNRVEVLFHDAEPQIKDQT